MVYMKRILLFTLFLISAISIGYSQNEPTDCIQSIVVCGNTNLELNSNGVGTNDFALAGNNPPSCNFSESQSLWLRVNIVQSGTLAFTITPESSSTSEDYDFAIYGPNVTCSNLGSSIRCSSTNPTSAGVSTLTGLNDTELDFTEGPAALGNGFVRSIDALAGEVYYILVDNFSQNAGFDLNFTGTALLPDSPINSSNNTTDLNLTECDVVGDSQDGITNFNLESNTAAILGTQINTTVTYHNTAEDASINNSALASPYLSTQNNETIYVRIENTLTGCFIIDSFTLSTTPGPSIVTPTPFIICDDNTDGNDANGFAPFLLSDKDNEILNGSDPAINLITYHLSQTGANTGTDIIDKNTPFINTANPQTIFVRAQFAPSESCLNTFSFTSFDLEVNPLPISNSVSLIQCDEYQNPSDGLTLFNLNEVSDQITAGAANRTVLFFENLISANTGTPAITNTQAYQNTATNQQLFARVTDNINGCFKVATVDLGVSVTSASNAIIRACDDDGNEDGFREFDLTSANGQILLGISNLNLGVTYYETLEDALSEINPITVITNSVALTQGQDIVYARIEDNLNQCFGINQVQLFLNPLPNIAVQDEFFLCQNQANIEIDADIPSNSNATDFTFLWSTGETTETIFVSQPGTYTVDVTTIQTGCLKTRTVEITASNVATIQSIDITDAADNNIVTINTQGIGDYEYAIEINGIIGDFQDDPNFTNVPPGFHTVYVRDKNGCLPVITRDISVVGFPEYFSPNGDGFHENWTVGGISAQVLSNSLIYIFDRYGKLLKQLRAGGNGWDGTYNGKLMPSNQYWYRVELEDGRILTGSFSLIR